MARAAGDDFFVNRLGFQAPLPRIFEGGDLCCGFLAALFLKELDQNVRRVNMGGDYHDTQVAWTMRQRATQEMAGSLRGARQYLRKEAALMHS